MILDLSPVSFAKQMDGPWRFPLVLRVHVNSGDNEVIMIINARTCSVADDGLRLGGKKKLEYALVSCTLKV